MTADQRITVAKAVSQLGVPELSIREAIKPLYPDNWQTIKSIKLSQFDSIAQALKDLAQSVNQVEPFEIEGDPDYNQENNNFYFGPGVDLENAAEEGFYCQLPTNLTVSEPDDLATQEAQQLKVSVLSTFSDIAVDLNRITSAIAYSAALQNFASFKEIHSATFRHHAQEYVEEFAGEYEQMLSELEDKCSPKQFLKEQKIFTIG